MRGLRRLGFVLDRGLTAANLLDRAARAHRDKALVAFDTAPGFGGLGVRASARDLQRFADRLGVVLRDRLGLAAFDRVGVMKANHGDIPVLGLAIIRSGCIAVPVHNRMGGDIARAYLAHCGVRCLITDLRTLRALFDGDAVPATVTAILVTDAACPATGDPRVHHLERLLDSVGDDASLAPVDLAPDEHALICHTSGTTGVPKGVLHTSGSLVAGIKGQLLIEPVTSRDRGLSASAFNHFINHLGLAAALAGGVETFMISEHDAEAIGACIDRERITVVFCFPHTYMAMLDQGLHRWRLDSVRLWLAGGDSSHEAHIRPFVAKGAFLRVFGRRIVSSLYVDTLGSSEVGFAALFRVIGAGTRRFGRNVGRPTFAGPKVRIGDARGRSLPPGEVGRLLVKGRTLFNGYWNAHDRSHGVIRDGWWWTGDLAYRDRNGDYHHCDRDVDVVRTAAGPVYSLMLEEHLLGYAGVGEAVVIGVADGRDGERALALLQSRPGMQIDLETIAAGLDARQQPPVTLIEVDADGVPRGLTGKVLKRELRTRYATIEPADSRRGAPNAAVI